MPPPSLTTNTHTPSHYSNLPVTPPDPILHLAALAHADPTPSKLDLTVGAFTEITPDGSTQTYTPSSVAKAAQIVAKQPHPYLPIDGHPTLSYEASRLIFGESWENKSVVSVSTVGASGAMRVALEFWRNTQERSGRVWVCQNTWPGHFGIPEGAGWSRQDILRFKTYESVCKELEENGKRGDLVILQSGAQNPTGQVVGKAEWMRILRTIQDLEMGLIWDVAYQGLAEGLEEDVWPVRKSVQMDIECFVCQSFSKTMGLYGERVGVLHVVSNDVGAKEAIRSSLKRLIRNLYSSPPAFGAKIAAMVLSDRQLRREWEEELLAMVMLVKNAREILIKQLESEFGNVKRWGFLQSQKGMFSYLSLTKDQVHYLRKHFHVYLAGAGRLSLASLPKERIAHFARAVRVTEQRIRNGVRLTNKIER